MSYAIIRVAKIKSAQQASAKTAHNYREHSLSNVDKDSPHPNREYLNTSKQNYGVLADQRIAQVVQRKVRADQVKAVEVIMTGSPEAFKRDEHGRAKDYSNSQWAQDNLHFLQKKYGKENVVSFTLHQDEKTPHIHAVVVPITANGRLSAKDLFTPQTLRELQTEYAQAMRPYEMGRGVEHSQTKHQAQRRLYGQSDRAAQLVPGPVVVQAVELGKIPLFGQDEWKIKEAARINEAFAQQVNQVQDRVNKAVQQAQANASAQEQVKTLRKQLATSEGLKQAHFTQLGKQEEELTRLKVALAQNQNNNPLINKAIEEGSEVREDIKTTLIGHLEQILKGKVVDAKDFKSQLNVYGYHTEALSQGSSELVHKLSGARFGMLEIKPNGRYLKEGIIAAIERTKREEEEQAQKQNKGPRLK